MTSQLIKDTFKNTYKDDYSDSDNYYKILFNNARSLQQRELNQMQTILTQDIQFGNQGLGYKNGMPAMGGKTEMGRGVRRHTIRGRLSRYGAGFHMQG